MSESKPDKKPVKKPVKPTKAEAKLQGLQAELDSTVIDLQRTRADFENYRKRVEAEKTAAREAGQSATIIKLLPVIDTIERAITHTPAELADNAWVQGVGKITKKLESVLGSFDLTRIDAAPGTAFDPELHEAIQFDEDSVGEHEVVVEELQPGYRLSGAVVRPAMVKVKRHNSEQVGHF